MKKFILLVAIAFFVSTGAFAQASFGIKGGANFGGYSGETIKLSNVTQWQLGIAARFKLPILQLGVQPEILYQWENNRNSSDPDDTDYIHIPLNAISQFQILGIGTFITAGPYLTYSSNFRKGFDFNNFQFVDWGIGLGGGVELGKLQVGLRMQWSLHDFEAKGRSLAVVAGFFF